MFESHFFLWDEHGIERVTFMGKTYVLRPAIEAALQLEGPMLQIWAPPIEVE